MMDILSSLLCVPAVVILLFTGFRLSLASGWLQIRGLPMAISSVLKSGKAGFTSTAALCAIIGGNLGVGNISGTAVALRSGGPGFIVWMVGVIVLTSIIKYATCYISISTKVTVGGKVFGGPVVYLQQAFKTKWTPLIAALITAVCALTVGNLIQVNSLSIPMDLVNKPPLIGGLLMAVALLSVNTLGINFITKVVSSVVPAMTFAYLTLAVVTLAKYSPNILPSLKLIFDNCLNLHSFRNGTMIAFIAETFSIIQVGSLRGIFATDIGLGLEGTVHSLVSKDHVDRDFVVQQSLISLISPFIVAVVTFITTVVLLATGVWTDPALESTNMCFTAFKGVLGEHYTEYALIVLMFCFSFTTVLTWMMCSKEALSYVFRSSLCGKIWTTLFTAVIPLGSLCTVHFLWSIADLSIALAITMNTLGILLILSKYKDMFVTSPT